MALTHQQENDQSPHQQQVGVGIPPNSPNPNGVVGQDTYELGDENPLCPDPIIDLRI